MNEQSKSHVSRMRHDEYKFLVGDVLDIGCGNDPIKLPLAAVRGWDIKDGDAQYLNGLKDKSFDAVVSSHCLEHMQDVEIALSNWARVLRDGGYMIVYVPSYLFYERRQWPSRYNPDHKAAFDLVDPPAKPGNVPFYALPQMLAIGRGCGLELMDARLELDNYDFRRTWDEGSDQTLGAAMAQVAFVFRKEA